VETPPPLCPLKVLVQPRSPLSRGFSLSLLLGRNDFSPVLFSGSSLVLVFLLFCSVSEDFVLAFVTIRHMASYGVSLLDESEPLPAGFCCHLRSVRAFFRVFHPDLRRRRRLHHLVFAIAFLIPVFPVGAPIRKRPSTLAVLH